MTLRTLSIALPQAMEAYVEERVAEGGYRSPEDYLRALIREDQERRVRGALEGLLFDGLESEAEPVTPEYMAELRREAKERIARRRRKA
jgi:antitoxin ParD1/3/4